MSSDADSLSAKAQSAYLGLAAVATDLNAASDELASPVSELDSTLKKLNLGIEVWVTIRGYDSLPEDTSHWSEDIGYAKVNGRWGIALRSVRGDYAQPDHDTIEAWLFNEGPRNLRLSAIGKIPELLTALTQQAIDTAKQIREKLTEVKEVAAAVKQAAEKPSVERVRFKPPEGQKK